MPHRIAAAAEGARRAHSQGVKGGGVAKGGEATDELILEKPGKLHVVGQHQIGGRIGTVRGIDQDTTTRSCARMKVSDMFGSRRMTLALLQDATRMIGTVKNMHENGIGLGTR